MKNKIILYSILALTTTAVSAQDQFKIIGKIPQVGNEKMILLNYINSEGKNAKDSVIVKNGEFTISGTTAYGNKAYLTLFPVKREPKSRSFDYIDFYLEKGTYNITTNDSLVRAKIVGTKVQQDYMDYNAQTADLLNQFKEISARFAKVYYAKVKDTIAIKTIQAEARPVHAKIEAALDAFIFSHPDSYVTADLILANKMMVIDVVKFEPYYKAMSKRVLSGFSGRKITDKYNKARQFAVGKVIDFTLPDAKGNEFRLSSLKGKYVLVDFWASWCVPCRAENPFLLKAYAELKDKNFEIVGVSLDDKRANWMKAVETDKLPWTQVSDVKGFQTEVAVRFGITAIPQNVLLDPQGKVIAKDLRGENVNKLIASYIK
ncbi:alkyl hydroperoxide reductase [Pedobacter yonginense]|uniref:Alkyl hydroperoxide reductase n=1 Tax=Pedobacter yonginense TaxID=651869 RepID=A0A317EP62_9SPHI|nr:TlpA disulfide reductase family protein [Pedobacter yonginense]PWS28621.1 alkyl hydroperoxide reductase [Pedobacter yonginense]